MKFKQIFNETIFFITEKRYNYNNYLIIKQKFYLSSHLHTREPQAHLLGNGKLFLSVPSLYCMCVVPVY